MTGKTGTPTAERRMSVSASSQPLMTRAQETLIDAAERIRLDAGASPNELAFITRELVLATLPHRQPNLVDGKLPPVWSRTNGNYTLSIQPGYARNHRGEMECVGYPCGTIPRLLLLFLNTEVVKKQQRSVAMGRDLRSFMRKIGLKPETGGGKRGDAARLKDQMNRLFRSTISFDYSDQNRGSFVNLRIADAATIFWTPHSEDQPALWESEVRLSEEFYKALLNNPVPIVPEAIAALKGSALALDLYVWASWMSFRAQQRGKAFTVSWDSLLAQFGSGYSNAKNFKREVKKALRKIEPVYPELRVSYGRGFLIVEPYSRPAVSGKPTRTKKRIGSSRPSADCA